MQDNKFGETPSPFNELSHVYVVNVEGWETLFGVTAWRIWNGRNKAIFANSEFVASHKIRELLCAKSRAEHSFSIWAVKNSFAKSEYRFCFLGGFMEGRRRQRWDNTKRSHKNKPPRGTWQPTVPKWEKDFCKVVGSLDWDTLLHMKKFMHLYENVLNWDDSAGEEALSNAKKRYWAWINGLPCNLLPPDPDLYIDKIDWDSEVDNTVSWPEFEPEFTADHEPVVIFGDSFFANQSYSLGGWGDAEENFSARDMNNNTKSRNIQGGDDWGQTQNWDSPLDNGPAVGLAGCSNNDLGWVDTVWPTEYGSVGENTGRGLARAGYWEPKPDERHGAREWNSSHVGPLATVLL
ncbi:Unknown protein [Striga hermonthica]|uniref:Uncharacterized protein n=1 Tax=Striga hermonthica TaxID=68872 RepID=A0A9N7MTE6_STRHE|nr:Unknown protein [Striga hermonthica]